MSDGHVRPTRTSNGRRTKKTPVEPSGSMARRWWWIALLALPVIAIIPAAWYILSPPEHDDIELTIREYGFDPLTPPNQLRGPGALYQVEGSSYTKICDADPEILTGKVQTSPTVERVRKRLEQGKLSLAGNYVDEVNAKLDGARVTSIEYRMKDVSIREIPMNLLMEIESHLLSQKHCDEIVQRVLKANKQVCSGYSALAATTSYTVHYDVKFGLNAETKLPVVNAVQKAIEENAGGTIHIRNGDELHGENLFYGIQLSKFCITPDTATEPSVRSQPKATAVSQAGRVAH
jgi:hypothetical protein